MCPAPWEHTYQTLHVPDTELLAGQLYHTSRRVPEVQPLSNNFLPIFLNWVGGTGQYRAKFASVERLLTYTWNITQMTFPTYPLVVDLVASDIAVHVGRGPRHLLMALKQALRIYRNKISLGYVRASSMWRSTSRPAALRMQMQNKRKLFCKCRTCEKHASC